MIYEIGDKIKVVRMAGTGVATITEFEVIMGKGFYRMKIYWDNDRDPSLQLAECEHFDGENPKGRKKIKKK